MAGLASIALAVAHLESLRGEEEEEHASSGNPPPPAMDDVRPVSSQSMPFPRLHGRMVSDDSIQCKNQDAKEMRAPAVVLDESPRMMPVYSVHPSSYYQQWYASGSYQPPPPPPSVPSSASSHIQSQPSVKETSPSAAVVNHSGENDPLSPEAEAKAANAGPVAALLHKLSLVTDDLEAFFSLMKALEQLALPDNAQPAEVPRLDETIVQIQVQRHDVLLGRGGETNHHLGNIQYRQLVKASQPAYLAAKRRDKPRIAAAIVSVVRARSGRFLKKTLFDHSWRDVGNVRAREKTSQALREGAPELRGNVEAYRTQLLTEAVDRMEGMPAADASNGTMMESGEEGSQFIATHEAMAPALMIPGMMHHFPRHYHPHHHLPMPMVSTAVGSTVYYHHPHHPVVYHTAVMPDAGGGQLYHPPPHMAPYGEKRAILPSATSSEGPPSKRPAVASRDERGEPGALRTETTAPPSLPLSGGDTETTPSSTVVAAIVSSAEHSEEEVPVPVRTLSPASSTSSAKVAASRGPRIKLLKQRIEDHGPTE